MVDDDDADAGGGMDDDAGAGVPGGGQGDDDAGAGSGGGGGDAPSDSGGSGALTGVLIAVGVLAALFASCFVGYYVKVVMHRRPARGKGVRGSGGVGVNHPLYSSTAWKNGLEVKPRNSEQVELGGTGASTGTSTGTSSGSREERIVHAAGRGVRTRQAALGGGVRTRQAALGGGVGPTGGRGGGSQGHVEGMKGLNPLVVAGVTDGGARNMTGFGGPGNITDAPASLAPEGRLV